MQTSARRSQQDLPSTQAPASAVLRRGAPGRAAPRLHLSHSLSSVAVLSVNHAVHECVGGADGHKANRALACRVGVGALQERRDGFLAVAVAAHDDEAVKLVKVWRGGVRAGEAVVWEVRGPAGTAVALRQRARARRAARRTALCHEPLQRFTGGGGQERG